jgi:hypothetical protein
LLLPSAVRAEDWPQWRGLNRDGVWNETGIMESFPPGGLKVRWRVPVGRGWSSPVVAQGRVMSPTPNGASTAKERVLWLMRNGKALEPPLCRGLPRVGVDPNRAAPGHRSS